MSLDRRSSANSLSSPSENWYRHIGAEEQPEDLSASTYRVHYISPKFHTQHPSLPSFAVRYKSYGYMGELGMRRSEVTRLMQDTGSGFLEHRSANIPMEEVARGRFGTTYKQFHRGIYPTDVSLTPTGSRVLPHEQLHVEGGISVAECDEQPPCSLPAETLRAMPTGEAATEYRRYRRVFTAPAYGADAVHPSTSTVVTDLNAGPTPVPPADARPVASVANLGAKASRYPSDGHRSRRLRVKPSTLVLMRQNTRLHSDNGSPGMSALPILQHGYGPQNSGRPIWGYSYYGQWSHSPYSKRGLSGSSSDISDMPAAGIQCLVPH